MDDQTAQVGYRSQARATTKRFAPFGTPQGTLTLANGRLRFERLGGRLDFDAPLDRIQGFCRPAYMLGAGFRFDLLGKRWWIGFNKLVGTTAFLRSAGPAAELAGMAFEAVDLGSQWTLASAWADVFARAGLLGEEAAAEVARADSRYTNLSVLAAPAPASGDAQESGAAS
jgi:hypothetical protein